MYYIYSAFLHSFEILFLEVEKSVNYWPFSAVLDIRVDFLRFSGKTNAWENVSLTK